MFKEFLEQLRKWEGLRLEAYWDRSRWSIGYGTYSHEGEVITEEEAETRFIRHATYVWDSLLPRVVSCYESSFNKVRKLAIALMIYQLGLKGVQNFKNMLKSINKGDWASASYHASDSNWRDQTPKRARFIGNLIYYGRM